MTGKPLYDTTSSKSVNANLILAFISVLIIIALFWSAQLFANEKWILLSFNADLASNWQNIFTKYFFIIISIERAASVWVGITRNQNKKAWEKRVIRIRQVLERGENDPITLSELERVFQRERKIISDIERNDGEKFLGNPDPTIDDHGNILQFTDQKKAEVLSAYLHVTKQIYEFKLAKFEEQTSRSTTRLVFFGGLIVAIIGVSIVSDIINVADLKNSDTNSAQLFFYRVVDTVITGGLIGGGSKGFSLFINTLHNVFERVKDPKSSI